MEIKIQEEISEIEAAKQRLEDSPLKKFQEKPKNDS